MQPTRSVTGYRRFGTACRLSAVPELFLDYPAVGVSCLRMVPEDKRLLDYPENGGDKRL
jgi:hypothetical protein